MKEKVKDMVTRVRVALDEITGVDVDSDFVGDMNLEIEQALLTAATELSEELPDHLLMPTTMRVVETGLNRAVPFESPAEHGWSNTDGTGWIALPADFLRFVSLRLSSWTQDVRVIIDTASNEGRMQASTWTRGTPQKPRVMLGGVRAVLNTVSNETETRRELLYYTAGKSGNNYQHEVETFSYVPMPEIETNEEDTPPTKYLDAGLHDRAIPLIVNRACAIILEAKQNTALAERFRAMSAVS